MTLSILYRGPLSSCNYGCPYCPFALRKESRAELDRDRLALDRFVEWVARREDLIAPREGETDGLAGGATDGATSVFFTPWGEALVRRWYRDAIARLTSMRHVRRVAIQTNLSAPTRWLDRCDLERLALWVTYHPGQVARSDFLARASELLERGARFSVGVVGLHEHLDEIRALRAALPSSVYLWINAYRRKPGYYSEADLDTLEAIDPLFRINTRAYPSAGRGCRCGTSVVSVDGDGNARRCHFLDGSIGNIYEPGFENSLVDRPCPAPSCRCHIGYVHMDDLALDDIYRDGILERIPDPSLDRATLIETARRLSSLRHPRSLVRRSLDDLAHPRDLGDPSS